MAGGSLSFERLLGEDRDNGSFVMVNNLVTSGWQWMRLTGASLGVGSHTLTIAYREDGAHLDKIAVTTSTTAPTGTGSPATNCSQALTQRVGTTSAQTITDDKISMYPNPVTNKVNINLGRNVNAIRRIQVLDVSGRVVRDIMVQNTNISILTRGFSPGTYLVRMQGNEIIQHKIVVQ